MTTRETEEFLLQRDVRPTPNRILVTKALADAEIPVSLQDLETVLDTLDKASIFRALETFAAKDIVHTIDDGSRAVKYELCGSLDRHHSVDDQHPHFHCEVCGRTYCFDSIHIPSIPLPQGFSSHSINYVVKGKCPKCKNK